MKREDETQESSIRRPRAALLVAMGLGLALTALSASAADNSGQNDRAHGRYLAEQVAMCVVCHSPKDASGHVIEGSEFEGSSIPLKSPYPDERWAIEAPALAGMTFYSREQAIRLLTTGIARNGKPPTPPMPPFRMTRSDAAAIYDFLASLHPDQ
jgi:mono/diheme cytochrome c family protein